MKLIFTEQALISMDNSFLFLIDEQGFPLEKIEELRERIKISTQQLLQNPYLGQQELQLVHLKKSHRRLVEWNFKIVYYVENDLIYITDIFDARQDPKKIKG
jgi:plasmid stabilization system protein ParE